MKNILVFGGHGFMGKNLQNEFKGSDYRVTYISRFDNVDLRNLEQTIECIDNIQPDVIIFAAADVGSISYVSEYAADVVHNNTQMYLNLYGALSALKSKATVINPISNCSYPGIIDIQNEEDYWSGPIHESVQAYGMPKRMGYIISQCYAKQYGIKTVNLIMPNAYGPNDYLDEQKTHAMNGIIMRMMKAQKNGDKEFSIWGSGTPIREWLYMPDMARLMKQIIDTENFDLPNPINIGQESGVAINETVAMVKEALNYDVELVHDTTKQDGAPIKVLGNKLFTKHFSEFIFTPYEEGIKNTIKYYENLI